MLILYPDCPLDTIRQKELYDIIKGHFAFMSEFMMYDDILYFVIVAQNSNDVDCLPYERIDSVNSTGNYYEISFIQDAQVVIAIVDKKLSDNRITDLLDEFS